MEGVAGEGCRVGTYGLEERAELCSELGVSKEYPVLELKEGCVGEVSGVVKILPQGSNRTGGGVCVASIVTVQLLQKRSVLEARSWAKEGGGGGGGGGGWGGLG